MSDNPISTTLPDGVNIQEYIAELTKAKALNHEMAPIPLDGLFVGEQFASMRADILREGVTQVTGRDGQLHTFAVDLDKSGNVMAVAAAVPRTPGKAQDFINDIADFKIRIDVRNVYIPLLRRVYLNEGLINNAVNKVAALIATNGSFKVRKVAGVRGKGGDKRAEEFRSLLQYWVENVNGANEDAVVTGGRGMQAFIASGVRTALIEGDHFARTNWAKVKVPTLKDVRYSLPMNIQTFGGDVIQIPDEAAALGLEWIYWVPAKSLINSLSKPKDPELKAEFTKLVPSDVQAKLKKDGKYRLDPRLMAHIRHRPQMGQPYGESFITAAMSSIAYKRALMALDIVTIESLVNRLLLIKVGDSNPDSVYHKQEVSARRVKLLENMMRRIGPSSTIIWAGPDIAIEEAGAHGSILDTDGRHALANSMIRQDMGTPAAILTGEGADGKASALAAIIAVAAQIKELQDQYKQTLKTWAERIGLENKFEDVEVDWEFEPNPLINKTETTAQMLQAFQVGVLPLQVLVEAGFGLDWDSTVQMMAEEVTLGYREKMFGAPQAILDTIKQNPLGTGGAGGTGGTTTNPTGTGGGGGKGGKGGGRPSNDQAGNGQDPRNNTETTTTPKV